MMKNKIRLLNFNNLYIEDNNFSFFVGKNEIPLNRLDENVYSFSYEREILGNEIYVIKDNEKIFVSTEELPLLKEFDDFYFYDGDDLGPSYLKEKTTFKLWAPLATKVFLNIKNNKFEMLRMSKGVYEITIDGDLDGELYDFSVIRDGKEYICIDPYAKSSNANGKKSAVIDLEKTRIDMHSNCLQKFENNVEAIIYETHVRDFTISAETNIVNKGKYLGLAEENRKSNKGNPVGLEYLKYLGISHLQLLPILDFGSVDELTCDKYNWGYDPMQFFSLEGSYSLNPNDPYSRINEFKKLVSVLHQNNIRINLDVVFNHIYKVENFSLNLITPNYFFRIENDKLSDHSGCGNDFASERLMARKIIIDSITFLLKEYDIDGFRFDLMGLLDVETMNLVEQKVHSIKKNAMIYGEGWDLFATSPYTDKFANYKNAPLLSQIAFFNDSYRNIIRGTGNKPKLDENGFLLGNKCFEDGFEFAFRASTLDFIYPKLFTSFNQSINYVECHDNQTIGDVIKYSVPTFNEKDVIDLFNKVLVFSPGVPFIHMGQEIGQSKQGEHNTYNFGDDFNKFDINLLDERFDLVNSLKNYINLRKSLSFYRLTDSNQVNSQIKINKNDSFYDISLNDMNKIHILINKDENYSSIKDVKYNLIEPNIIKEELTLKPHSCSIVKE